MKAPKSSVSGLNTPGYMKSTSSSEARRKLSPDSGAKSMNRLCRISDLENRGVLVKKPSLNLDVKRATCSSTMKDRNFPDFLSLNPGGTEGQGVSTVKVCPYAYCSLNGHYHHASFTSLKCFISEKRDMIKAQKGLTPVNPTEEIIAEFQSLELNSEASELEESSSLTKIELCLVDCKDDEGKVDLKIECLDETVKNSAQDNVSLEEVKLISDEEASFAQDLLDEDVKSTMEMPSQEISGDLHSFELNLEDSTLDHSSTLESYVGECEDMEFFDKVSTPADVHLEEPKLHCEEQISSVNEGQIKSDSFGEDHDYEKANKRFDPFDDSIKSTHFNPKEPNFLPLKPEKEAEKVDLKHQELDDRKNSEEWMVDYALRQVVTKLRPARRKKVALLVEAFEQVIPPTTSYTHCLPLQNSTPIQACR